MFRRTATAALLLLLAARFASAQDGGFAVYPNCPAAPPATAIDGGYYFTEERVKRLDCMLATAEEQRDAARENQAPLLKPSITSLFIVGFVILTLGYVLGRTVK